MNKVMLLAAVPVLAGGVWAQTASVGAQYSRRIPIERSQPPVEQPASHVMDIGGAEFSIVGELVPDAIFIEGSTERIEYHAEVSSNLSTDATLAYTARLVDDLGNLKEDLGKGEGRIGPEGIFSTPTFRPGAEDGFYILSLRVAAVAGEREYGHEAVQFLRVRDQKMREMTATDWYLASQGTLVTLTPAGGVK